MMRLCKAAAILATGCTWLVSSVAQQGGWGFAPGKDFPLAGGNFANQRYSRLTQITPANVARLGGAWMVHVAEGRPTGNMEATPVVVDGVMYVPTGADGVVALNAATSRHLPVSAQKGRVGHQHDVCPVRLDSAIAHPHETLIGDTGAVPDSNFRPGGGPATLRYATTTKPLALIGYAPGDITYLALSHFHWDHVGNANLFAGATCLVPKAERDIMFSDPPSPRTEPVNYSALRNSKTIFLTRDEYDVFGDGAVVIKAPQGIRRDTRSFILSRPRQGQSC